MEVIQAYWGSGDPRVHNPLWILGFAQKRIQMQASIEFKVKESLLLMQ